MARAFLTVFVGGVVLAASYLALNPPAVEPTGGPARPVAQRYEWLVPVLLVDAVFVVFLVAQATVIFGGHDYLEETTGLTYAEYVHQGFGQLTVATALTLLVVWAAARKAPRATRRDLLWLRGSLGLLCAMTLVVVASALYRMHVYEEAYGFTELRLLFTSSRAGSACSVVSCSSRASRRSAAWLPAHGPAQRGGRAARASPALNPAAWVAERNLDRYAETGKIDWTYIQSLSADMVPAAEGPAGRRRRAAH